MIANIHVLSDTELQQLSLTENKRFSNGVENGLTYLDLKEIRTNLREINLEQSIRKTTF